MEYFCFKTNKKNIIDYLLTNIKNMNMNNIFYSINSFKIYENIIVHYKGDNSSEFFSKLSDILTKCILVFYEENKYRKILYSNYFYFDKLELEKIFTILKNTIDNDLNIQNEKKELDWASCLKYISENHSLIIDGFSQFRLLDYDRYLDQLVDLSVNQYIVEKEYTEFINLLKLYINSKASSGQIIHLVYQNGESILLDTNRNIIIPSEDTFDAKFLSDISFSSNDYALNTLLTILPKEIIIHLIDSSDEFINTLNLIFEERIKICTDCNICNMYKFNKKTHIYTTKSK